jgi:hypothetical protein
MSDTPYIAPFKTLGVMDFLRIARRGKLVDELEAEFSTLIQAVNATGNSGKITLTLDVKPSRNSQENATIVDSMKVTIPKFSNMGTLVFPTPEGRVSLENPAQNSIPGLRDANSEAMEQTERKFANATFAA